MEEEAEEDPLEAGGDGGEWVDSNFKVLAPVSPQCAVEKKCTPFLLPFLLVVCVAQRSRFSLKSFCWLKGACVH